VVGKRNNAEESRKDLLGVFIRVTKGLARCLYYATTTLSTQHWKAFKDTFLGGNNTSRQATRSLCGILLLLCTTIKLNKTNNRFLAITAQIENNKRATRLGKTMHRFVVTAIKLNEANNLCALITTLSHNHPFSHISFLTYCFMETKIPRQEGRAFNHSLMYRVLDGFKDNDTYVHIFKGLPEGDRLRLCPDYTPVKK